jgi:hypothetical protein
MPTHSKHALEIYSQSKQIKHYLLHEELEQNGRSLGRGGGLLAVAPHVPAERLSHLELGAAEVALVARRGLLVVLGRRRCGRSSLGGRGRQAQREAVAAAQVAGAVAAQRLERRERAVAGLAHELTGRAAVLPLGALRDAEGEREGEGHAVAAVSRVLRHAHGTDRWRAVQGLEEDELKIAESLLTGSSCCCCWRNEDSCVHGLALIYTSARRLHPTAGHT